MPSLTFYYMEHCPYCQKVLDYLRQRNISVPFKNTQENMKFRSELMEIGGKTQVPCLVIDGQALYESDEIIRWFEKNWPPAG
ncbi:MAG: glutathione S-transferase N-terminal domain-containing protein [Candidatus Omnitrophota bacterium]